MKKLTISLLVLLNVNFAVAQLVENTEYSYEYAWSTCATISYITGSGFSSSLETSALRESSTAWLLDSAIINFGNSGKIYTLENTKFGFANYSIGLKGDSALNFGAGSKDSLIATSGISNTCIDRSNGKNELTYSNLTITVDKEYEGTISMKVVACLSQKTVELNLAKSNALVQEGDVRLYTLGEGKMRINVSANQNFCWDARGNGYIFNVNNGAQLFFNSFSTLSGQATTHAIDTLDGDILFTKSMVDSYDAENLSVVLCGLITGDTEVTFYNIFFTNNTGSDLFMGEKTIGGVDYVYISNTQIPEPAEWAAIFGAVALAFAAYRRRK